MNRLTRPASRAVGVAAAAFATLALGLAPVAAASGASPLPPDPNAHGYIGLCDTNGNNVAAGSVAATPFVWKAIASVPPPKQYLGRGENAILGIYQPRPGVDPGDWSGDYLTGASFYSTPSQPTVQATYADLSLSTILKEFPPLLDGLYVLRMGFGKAGYGLYSATYPTTTIQVTGNSWHVISGGTVSCNAGKATSQEVMTGVISKAMATPRNSSPGQPGSAGATGGTSSRSGGAGGATGTNAGAGQQRAGTPSLAAADSSRSSGDGTAWGLGAAGVAVAAIGSILLARSRRRRAATSG